MGVASSVSVSLCGVRKQLFDGIEQGDLQIVDTCLQKLSYKTVDGTLQADLQFQQPQVTQQQQSQKRKCNSYFACFCLTRLPHLLDLMKCI